MMSNGVQSEVKDKPQAPTFTQAVRRAREAAAEKKWSMVVAFLQNHKDEAQQSDLASFLIGLSLLGLGQRQDAYRWLANCLKLNPEHEDALCVLGMEKLSVKRFGEAVKLLEVAVKVNPGNAQAFQWLGQALEGIKQMDMAYAAYLQAYRLNSKLYRLHTMLARCHLLAGNLEEADKLILKANELFPEDEAIQSDLKALAQLKEQIAAQKTD